MERGLLGWMERLTAAKAALDQGLCRVGPAFRSVSPLEAFLVAGANRAVRLADAVAALARQDHSPESLPLLRHLAETAAAMRWAASEPSRAAMAGPSPSWEALWSDARLRDRCAQAGIPAAHADAILALAPRFVTGGASVLPWSHAACLASPEPPAPEEVLREAERWMGHVLAAMEQAWPGCFPAGAP